MDGGNGYSKGPAFGAPGRPMPPGNGNRLPPIQGGPIGPPDIGAPQFNKGGQYGINPPPPPYNPMAGIGGGGGGQLGGGYVPPGMGGAIGRGNPYGPPPSGGPIGTGQPSFSPGLGTKGPKVNKGGGLGGGRM